jgi:hypothetical protein
MSQYDFSQPLSRKKSWKWENESLVDGHKVFTDVVIANGLLSSLAIMLEAVSAPGDGVIFFTPVYHYFFDVITGSGRVPLCCDLVCDENSDAYACSGFAHRAFKDVIDPQHFANGQQVNVLPPILSPPSSGQFL